MLKIDIITLFPKMFVGPFDESIIARAQKNGLVDIKIHDLRQWGLGERRTVDDRPYGGGVGMIIRVDVVDRAISNLKFKISNSNERIILLTPRGKTYSQSKARELSQMDHLILICGHYEGFDQRIADHLVDEEVSIGNYVLTGGEIPAMVIADSVIRLIPGVVPKPEATELESFSTGENIEHSQYTRPEKFQDWEVPKVLLSGDHKKIKEWQDQQ